MAPRNPAHIGPDGRGFFGTVTVGQRGQVAVPAQARKHLGLEPGDHLVVLTDPAQGIALIPLRFVLDRGPDDPLSVLVRSALGRPVPSEPVPSGPVPSGSGAPPGAPPGAPGSVAGSAGAPAPASDTAPVPGAPAGPDTPPPASEPLPEED